MAVVKPVVFQVVGYQNSGKTTFIEKIIEELAAIGLKTAVIKHHGHGGKPNVCEQKDSTRHVEAGAAATIVEGDGRLLLHAEGKRYDLHDQVQLLGFFQPEVILIEGYKFAEHPKVALIKTLTEAHLLHKLENIQAVVYWEDSIKEYVQTIMAIPCFSISNSKAITFIVQWLKKQVNEI
ncbi:molybdopterin-guanine dinucleotide biosynthesis protein B [Bacillus rubiinfantis]|uniref:molybdopterin-guanine dinucleotide biosynthesis protein B n=1 Tax=Bacillus rubiinfantis TaxID=1499680 RepID=UPI0005A8B9D2|nr:molybdopterin-guanine dinucleotide biosynthesis protein B [Bacillus rubiinfantis]